MFVKHLIPFGIGAAVSLSVSYFVLNSKSASPQISSEKEEEQIVDPKPPSPRFDFSEEIRDSIEYANLIRSYRNVPGMVIGVSYRGEPVWIQGFGYANIELSSPCHGNTVMRVASVSKSISSLLIAKMVEEKKLDLDEDINKYVDESKFPLKYVGGEKVTITLRHLLSHSSGIRHYKRGEHLSNIQYSKVDDSIKIFSHDDLAFKPGTSFLYSTFAWTLVSAVVESVLPDKNFSKALMKMCRDDFGMKSTYLDENDPIIFNRASQYIQSFGLQNAPAINVSYKWAGGGLLSTVSDLLKFGNVVMYSYLGGKDNLPGQLNSFNSRKIILTFFKLQDI